MESKKDDGSEKARFVVVRDEIYKWYTDQEKDKDQVASLALKRSITQWEEEGEVIEMDGDVTSPSAAKQVHRTLADRLMKRPTVEEFINAWSEAVLGKGLTFDFFRDPLVCKVILVYMDTKNTSSDRCSPAAGVHGNPDPHLQGKVS